MQVCTNNKNLGFKILSQQSMQVHPKCKNLSTYYNFVTEKYASLSQISFLEKKENYAE